MHRSPPGSSVQGILQARILEWVALPSSRGSFPTQGSRCPAMAGRFFTTSVTWEEVLCCSQIQFLVIWVYLSLPLFFRLMGSSAWFGCPDNRPIQGVQPILPPCKGWEVHLHTRPVVEHNLQSIYPAGMAKKQSPSCSPAPAKIKASSPAQLWSKASSPA